MTVRVAVIDSGANAPHPHLPAVAGGVAFDLEGGSSDDYADRLGHGIAIVCAGTDGRPTLEDTYAAHRLEGLLTGRPHPMGERAPIDVLRESEGGRNLLALGLGADLDFCAEVSVSETVPRLDRRGILVAAP